MNLLRFLLRARYIQGVPKVMCQTFGLISQLRIVRFQKFLRERAGIFTHSRNMSKAIKSKFIFSNERSFFAFFYRFLCLDQVHFYMFVFGPPSFIISEKNHYASGSDDRDIDRNVIVHDVISRYT